MKSKKKPDLLSDLVFTGVVSTQNLRCVYSTRVVVPAHLTPSGKRYDFQPGQQQPVNFEDINYLLSLKRNQSAGCCGSGNTGPINYFQEV